MRKYYLHFAEQQTGRRGEKLAEDHTASQWQREQNQGIMLLSPLDNTASHTEWFILETNCAGADPVLHLFLLSILLQSCLLITPTLYSFLALTSEICPHSSASAGFFFIQPTLKTHSFQQRLSIITHQTFKKHMLP